MEKSIIFLVLLASISISCSENSSETRIVEPAGSAHYYINNQSNTSLTVIFTKSPELASEIDTVVVPSDSLKIIFKDGIIGVNPKPSNSFSKIKFYRISDKSESVFTIDPIKNQEWNVIGKDRRESGYGLTEYGFTITNNLLK